MPSLLRNSENAITPTRLRKYNIIAVESDNNRSRAKPRISSMKLVSEGSDRPVVRSASVNASAATMNVSRRVRLIRLAASAAEQKVDNVKQGEAQDRDG